MQRTGVYMVHGGNRTGRCVLRQVCTASNLQDRCPHGSQPLSQESLAPSTSDHCVPVCTHTHTHTHTHTMYNHAHMRVRTHTRVTMHTHTHTYKHTHTHTHVHTPHTHTHTHRHAPHTKTDMQPPSTHTHTHNFSQIYIHTQKHLSRSNLTHMAQRIMNKASITHTAEKLSMHLTQALTSSVLRTYIHAQDSPSLICQDCIYTFAKICLCHISTKLITSQCDKCLLVA